MEIDKIIKIDLDYVIEMFNYIQFYDHLSYLATGNDMLQDIAYNVVGVTDDGLIKLQVTGYIEEEVKL